MVETLRVLAPLALWMHETSPGVGLVKREEMRRKLEAIYAERGVDDPEKAAAQLSGRRARPRRPAAGAGPREYGFIHLTFQEYLAAVAIAQQGQQSVEPVVEALAAHVGDDNWHEVSLLTIGYLGIIQQRDEAAGAVLLELMARTLVSRGKQRSWPGSACWMSGRAA